MIAHAHQDEPRKFALHAIQSMTRKGDDMDSRQKPTIEEVLRYATPQVRKFIGEAAADLPSEQREEIEQEAYTRLVAAYEQIDPALGWKSFVYNHCRGAVLDYLKFGRGFHEQRWSIAKDEENGSRNMGKIRDRVEIVSEDQDVDIDHVLGSNGVSSLMTFDRININWDLVARMASQDEALHAFALHIRGVGIEEMAPVFGLCRARVGQLIQAFVERFDDPEHADCPWFRQAVFAFGLCEHLGMKVIDQSLVYGFRIGWPHAPVDLDDLSPCREFKDRDAQMDMFASED